MGVAGFGQKHSVDRLRANRLCPATLFIEVGLAVIPIALCHCCPPVGVSLLKTADLQATHLSRQKEPPF